MRSPATSHLDFNSNQVAFPMTWQDIMQVYSQATQRPFGYITLELHPASDDTRRLFSHLLRHEAECMWI